MTKHRKRLVIAKTTTFWQKQVIHYKCLKVHAMTKVLENTLTYQIWIESDKKMMIL